ncbi:hypothetical protein GGS21DRAFT_493588 [Xylaria nigripes]|nr:hypothetical protein GGS21DRAFT_493588 [Xylaria nigripes]
MPGGPDTDSQFRFLIACIRHSTSGRVDFEEVRKECGIVTKGAAAKRYERLMKAHNIGTGTLGGGVKKEATELDEEKKPKPRRAPKKRKLAEVDDDEGDTDEPVKPEPHIKGEVKYEEELVKPECSKDDLAVAKPEPLLERPTSLSQPPLPTTPNTPTIPTIPTPPATQPGCDDDDEVLFVSAIEKCSAPEAPAHSFDHCPSLATLPMSPMNGSHFVNYAANMSFPQQSPSAKSLTDPLALPIASVATRMTASSNSFPYGFAPATWVYPHESHIYP